MTFQVVDFGTDRKESAYVTSYWFSIVTMVLCCCVSHAERFEVVIRDAAGCRHVA